MSIITILQISKRDRETNKGLKLIMIASSEHCIEPENLIASLHSLAELDEISYMHEKSQARRSNLGFRHVLTLHNDN